MNGLWRKMVLWITLVAFLLTSAGPSFAQAVGDLPQPGIRVGLSQPFQPAVLKGVKVFENDPFRFQFILDQGQGKDGAVGRQQFLLDAETLHDESIKVIKYFLAGLTVPEQDLWVNLSPYEKDRIVPDQFGQTEMGRDLLAQDYLLKQITASIVYPEGDLGKVFWAKVYQEAFDKYGTTDIPVDTFNKVWIVPDEAEVFENDGKAFITRTHLKVMLESDYALLDHALIDAPELGADMLRETQELTKNVLREVVVPEIEREVNEGETFAQLRQLYHSLILATWFKKRMQESLLAQIYVDQKKVSGVEIDDPQEAKAIWTRYVDAFKRGVYNYIKEEEDPLTEEIIPRKYFSGGADFSMLSVPGVLAFSDNAQNLEGEGDGDRFVVEDVAFDEEHDVRPDVQSDREYGASQEGSSSGQDNHGGREAFEKTSLEALMGQLEALRSWQGSSAVVRRLADSMIMDMEALQKKEAEARSGPEAERNILINYKGIIAQVVMLLHAQAWLSPTQAGSSYRSRGFYQNYSTTAREGYERNGMFSPEIDQHLLKKLTGRDSGPSLLFRNMNIALYSVLSLVLPDVRAGKGEGGKIYVSSDMDPQIIALLQLVGKRDGLGVIVVDAWPSSFPGEGPDLWVLSQRDAQSQDVLRVLGPVASSRKLSVIYSSKEKMEFRAPEHNNGVYGIYDIEESLGDEGRESSGALVVAPSKGLIKKLKNSARLGGLIDSFTFWSLMLELKGHLIIGDMDKETPVGAILPETFGKRGPALGRAITRYERLYERLREAYENFPTHYLLECVYQLEDDLETLQKMRDATVSDDDFFTGEEAEQFYAIDNDYHPLVRLLGHLIYSQEKDEEGRMPGLEQELEAAALSVRDPVVPGGVDGRPLQPAAVLNQSAMSSFRSILEHVLAENPSSKILLGNNVYYELGNMLVSEASRVRNMDEHNVDEIVAAVREGGASALFMDPIANSMPGPGASPGRSEYPAFDLKKIIAGLCSLDYDKPFYFVLDTTSMGPLFRLSDYLDGVDIPANFHFLLVESGQKMMVDGEEPTTAGLVYVFSPDEKEAERVAQGVRQARDLTGGRLGFRQLELLNAIGFDKESIQQRAERIHANTLRTARFLQEKQQMYPGLHVVYPGLDSHPDHGVAVENYTTWGPFFFLSVGEPKENANFDALLQSKLAERGVIAYVRDSYGFQHFSSSQYYNNALRRYALGEEDDVQMSALEDCFEAALEEFFRSGQTVDNGMDVRNGGIDLRSDRMSVDVKSSGDAVKFNLSPAMLQRMKNVSGFSPVILDVRPLNSLRGFLGLERTVPDMAASFFSNN